MIKTNIENSNIEHLFVAAQALQNQYRQQIFSILSENNSLSFNDFLKLLNISRSKLAYHLNMLMKNNIIINFYDKREGAKDHSFYELSSLGRGLHIGSFELLEKFVSIKEDELIKSKEKSISANFRTLRSPKYKSFEKVTLKLSNDKITPLENKKLEYNDPFLNVKIKKIMLSRRTRNKIELPTARQYYNMHKQPFKNINNISNKY